MQTMTPQIKEKIAAVLTGIWKAPSNKLLSGLVSVILSKSFALLCALLSCCCLALQFHYCMSPAIQYDSAASIFIIETGYEELIKITAADVHPPLYYIILKGGSDLICMLFPALTTVQACKLVSLIPFVLMCWLCLTTVRKTWGWYVAGLGSLSMVTAPLALEIGMEIRMYSWAMFFVLANYVFSFKALQTNAARYWALFALSGVAAAYTHTYACIAVMPIYLYCGWCSIRSKNRRAIGCWIVSCIFAVVSFLPWLGILLQQTAYVAGGFWIPRPTRMDILRYLVTPYGFGQILAPTFPDISDGKMIVCLIIGGCGLVTIMLGYWSQKTKAASIDVAYALCGLSIYPFLLIVGLLLTYTMAPAFHSRSLVPGISCTWLALLLLSRISPRNLVQPILVCLVLISAWVQVKAYHHSQSMWASGADKLIECVDQAQAEIIITPSKLLAVPLAMVLDKPVYVYKGTGDFPAAWYNMACRAHHRILHLSTEDDLKSLLYRHHSALYIDGQEEGEALSQLSSIRHQPLLPKGTGISMYRFFHVYSVQTNDES